MSNKTTISIGCDHAGFELKEILKKHLALHSYELIDEGTYSIDSVDYPDFAHPVAIDVEQQKAFKGILVCGSANGVAITANKHDGIRAAICWTTEIASLARQHNDANIICLPARFISHGEAIEIINTFLKTEFEGGRHQGRVDKISSSSSE
jgi:ribose 5-phosphate isomerase B